MLYIREFEIGPHFLTVYGEEPIDLYAFAAKLHPRFSLARPELMDIQQADFKHEDNDPKVYHVYGQPAGMIKAGRVLKPCASHFHIRYGYRPTLEDVEQVKKLIETTANEIGTKVVIDANITNLEDVKANEFDYPEIPTDKSEYLSMIARLKGG